MVRGPALSSLNVDRQPNNRPPTQTASNGQKGVRSSEKTHVVRSGSTRLASPRRPHAPGISDCGKQQAQKGAAGLLWRFKEMVPSPIRAAAICRIAEFPVGPDNLACKNEAIPSENTLTQKKFHPIVKQSQVLLEFRFEAYHERPRNATLETLGKSHRKPIIRIHTVE